MGKDRATLMIQLEYLVADAKRKGCDTLVSVGGVQSNHTRAVTATATASGMKGMSPIPLQHDVPSDKCQL